MLDTRDENDRVHPKISSLKARTGRMAISRPPFQQLPSSGRKIRDCLIADPGYQLVSCDYDQVEMKLLAGLTQDETMLKVMSDGVDIFNYTAEVIYGKDYTKKQRKALKAAGYGTCYGGGPKTIAKQTGLTLGQAKKVQGQYLETYPGIKLYSRHLELLAQEDPDLALYNAAGRKLPLDSDRMYSALNYMIQSTARDVFAQAIMRMDAAGLTDYLLLPVHDEIIAQAPMGYCKDLAKKIGTHMTTDYEGVALTAEGEVIGGRWGDAYH
jgi:DNA polymerase-1